MAKIDFKKLDTYRKTFDGILQVKKHVVSEEALPASGAQNGDIYTVGDSDTLYMFNNGEWGTLGSGGDSDDKSSVFIHIRESDLEDGTFLLDIADFCDVVLNNVYDPSLQVKFVDSAEVGFQSGLPPILDNIIYPGGYGIAEADGFGKIVLLSEGRTWVPFIPDTEAFRYFANTSLVKTEGVVAPAANLLYDEETFMEGSILSEQYEGQYADEHLIGASILVERDDGLVYRTISDFNWYVYYINIDFENNSRWGIVRSISKSEYPNENPDLSRIIASDEIMNGLIGKRIYYGTNIISF